MPRGPRSRSSSGGRAKLTLDAADPTGRYLNDVETEMTVIDPQLGTRKLPLVQTAPGRYLVEFDTPKAGAYHVELTQKKNGQELSRQSRGLTVGYSDELRLHRPTRSCSSEWPRSPAARPA